MVNPSVGRVAHFVADNGTHYAAMITRVGRDSRVDLILFPPGFLPLVRVDVPRQEPGFEGPVLHRGTWHSPELVGDAETEPASTATAGGEEGGNDPP